MRRSAPFLSLLSLLSLLLLFLMFRPVLGLDRAPRLLISLQGHFHKARGSARPLFIHPVVPAVNADALECRNIWLFHWPGGCAVVSSDAADGDGG